MCCEAPLRLCVLICFHRSPPQFLLKMKRFASIKDCSRFSALCDLLEPFKIFFKKFLIFPYFSILEKKFFRLREEMFFCCFQLWKNGFRCHFTLGSPYDFAYLVFFKSSQPSAQVFAKHGFASVSRLLQ